jgi:hypothetical protein
MNIVEICFQSHEQNHGTVMSRGAVITSGVWNAVEQSHLTVCYIDRARTGHI